MGIFTATTIAKASLELALGICIKLLIDNGRIHPADFVNDFLFWLPGVDAQDGDGLSRQMAALIPEATVDEVVELAPESTPLAA